MPAAMTKSVFFILTILSQNDTLLDMKNGLLQIISRFILIILVILLGVWVALYVSLAMAGREAVEGSLGVAGGGLGGRLEVMSEGQMSGLTTSLSSDVETPLALLLPLKTVSEFELRSEATRAVVVMEKGKLELELYRDQAPASVASFLSLVEGGFYDGLKIHRVEPGFVIQVGDPASREASTSGDLLKLGAGYPGYRVVDEVAEGLGFGEKGMVGLANINYNGQYPNTSGSQFFITLAGASELDGKYNIFAKVVEGVEVLEKLEVGDVIETIEVKL
jgi:cyclophilin family peptidyl-prolyl cis-trans isomerase